MPSSFLLLAWEVSSLEHGISWDPDLARTHSCRSTISCPRHTVPRRAFSARLVPKDIRVGIWLPARRLGGLYLPPVDYQYKDPE
jgi:hypothetical protein